MLPENEKTSAGRDEKSAERDHGRNASSADGGTWPTSLLDAISHGSETTLVGNSRTSEEKTYVAN